MRRDFSYLDTLGVIPTGSSGPPLSAWGLTPEEAAPFDPKIAPFVLADRDQLGARRREKDLSALLLKEREERLRSCSIELAGYVVEKQNRTRPRALPTK